MIFNSHSSRFISDASCFSFLSFGQQILRHLALGASFTSANPLHSCRPSYISTPLSACTDKTYDFGVEEIPRPNEPNDLGGQSLRY